MLNFFFFVMLLLHHTIQICDYLSLLLSYCLFLGHLSLLDSMLFPDIYIPCDFSITRFSASVDTLFRFGYVYSLVPISHTPLLVYVSCTSYLLYRLLLSPDHPQISPEYRHCSFSSIPIPWHFRFHRYNALDR